MAPYGRSTDPPPESEPFLLNSMAGPPRRRPWWQRTPALIGLVLATSAAGAVLLFVTANRPAADAEPAAATSAAETALEQVAYTCSLADSALGDKGRTLTITTVGEEGGGTYGMDDVSCIGNATGMTTAVRRRIETTRALDGMQEGSWGTYSAFWNYHPDNGLNLTVTDESSP